MKNLIISTVLSKNSQKFTDQILLSVSQKFWKIYIEDQYPLNSRNEPLPRKIELPQGWSFHKLELKVSKGASGQIRLMYLVNTTDCVIKLVWIYSHEQFEKRPTEVDLKSVFKEILDY